MEVARIQNGESIGTSQALHTVDCSARVRKKIQHRIDLQRLRDRDGSLRTDVVVEEP